MKLFSQVLSIQMLWSKTIVIWELFHTVLLSLHPATASSNVRRNKNQRMRIKFFDQTLIVEYPWTNGQSMLIPVNLHVLLTTKPVIIETPEHINWCLAHKMETWSLQLLQQQWVRRHTKCWALLSTLRSTREQSHTQTQKQWAEQTLS